MTTFCLEQISNTRPLVPASADVTDLDVLTPNHFLVGTAGSSLPSTLSSDFDHRKRYARAQAYSDAICSRWFRVRPGSESPIQMVFFADRDLKTGDIVWLVEATSPRGYYPPACVAKLNFGSDGIVRSAEVKTMTGNLIRPIIKLAPVLPPSPDPS